MASVAPITNGKARRRQSAAAPASGPSAKPGASRRITAGAAIWTSAVSATRPSAKVIGRRSKISFETFSLKK